MDSHQICNQNNQQNTLIPYENNQQFTKELRDTLEQDYGINLSDCDARNVALNFTHLLSNFL